MANLNFIYGTMASGKSTQLIEYYNQCIKQKVKILVVKPMIDTKGDTKIVSRNNMEIETNLQLNSNDSIFMYPKLWNRAQIILVDEAQFLTQKQVEEFWLIAHRFNVPVYCYGLKNDYLGRVFEGTAVLFSYADVKKELVTHCTICNNYAVFNARKVNNEYAIDGDQIQIDGENNVTYEPLCGDCFMKKIYGKKECNKILQRSHLKK